MRENRGAQHLEVGAPAQLNIWSANRRSCERPCRWGRGKGWGWDSSASGALDTPVLRFPDLDGPGIRLDTIQSASPALPVPLPVPALAELQVR